VGAALCVAGCLSPTLPLPPPATPTVSGTDAEGNVRLTGYVEPDSEVFALNRANNVISGQLTPSGMYDFKIQAEQNDRLSIWYVNDTVQSPSTEFVVNKAPGEP
jgi:hypothetical protein